MLLTNDSTIRARAVTENLALVGIASFCTNMGTWLYRLITSYVVWEATKSGFALSLLAIAEFLPNLVLTPYAGVVADRIQLIRASYVICCLLALLSFCAVAAQIIMPLQNFAYFVIVISAAMSIVSAFSRTVHQKILGYAFSKQSIGNALSLNTICLNVGRVTAPLALMGVFAVEVLWLPYLVNMLSYAVLGATTHLFRYHRSQENTPIPKAGIHTAIVSGLRALNGHGVLRSLLFLTAFEAVFLSAFFELLPMLTESYLHASAKSFTTLSIVVAIFSFFAGLAKFLTTFRLTNHHFPTTFFVASLLIPLGLFSGNLPTASVSFGVAMLLVVLVRISIAEHIHTEAPEQLKGQALGYYFLAISGGSSAGAALYAALHSWGLKSVMPFGPVIIFLSILVLRGIR